HDDICEGIRLEHEMLASLRDQAKYIIDTTNMKPRELSRTIERLLLRGEEIPLNLIISSFGFKRGIPQNADFVFDMRYTPNPFYNDELRELSGKDKQVQDFVFSDKRVCDQLDQLESMVELLVPAFLEQGKRRLMIAFGCTGGRHRSVAMAEALHDRLKNKFPVILEHRDLISEADDIRERFGKNQA
ncbi:MAG: RNase adaptor protein RapZ, partial [Clostridiales bacterium]|nr:RNase adaptor protein RapZ [Clostridiales bacterium]